jgi:hypothetical protein
MNVFVVYGYVYIVDVIITYTVCYCYHETQAAELLLWDLEKVFIVEDGGVKFCKAK